MSTLTLSSTQRKCHRASARCCPCTRRRRPTTQDGPHSTRDLPVLLQGERGASLFNDPPPPEGGWEGLARVLDALTPSIDTSIPLTPSQITDRIERMITQGQYDEALRVIAERKAQREAQNAMGADVQLLFLEARALGAAGRHNEAITVYRDMTVQYPELPEPWNNLASEYVRQGKLEMAEQALQTALATNPRYATARLNLGVVQLMLAKQSFDLAARQGASEAAALSSKTTQLLQP